MVLWRVMWIRENFNQILKQESCAIAKMTARCALYISAVKVFETPDNAYGYFSQIVLMPVVGYAHAHFFQTF